MRLGLALGYWGRGPSPDHVPLAQEAERLGYDSVWTAESWGSDAFTPLDLDRRADSRIRLGTAVAQMAARSPTATAMHALTLDHLSGGRDDARARAVRPPGRRGLVRAPVPEVAAHRDPGVRRRRTPGPAARGPRSSSTGRFHSHAVRRSGRHRYSASR